MLVLKNQKNKIKQDSIEKEANVMKQICNALNTVSKETQKRIWKWVADKYKINNSVFIEVKASNYKPCSDQCGLSSKKILSIDEISLDDLSKEK